MAFATSFAPAVTTVGLTRYHDHHLNLMVDTSEHSLEPTVDDLRVKLCYICREEEHIDSPPQPPVVWLHPCKCTLVAHKSCLLHWIKTQQREFGRSRGDLKCPQCGELYEFDGFNPRVLRIFNTVNRILSRTGRVVTACCVGTIILSSSAGIYLVCASYGAFAVREFVGPDLFQALLTSNPANWSLNAWFYLPMIPMSLIVSRTPLAKWTTSPLVPLLFPWFSTLPVSAVAHGSRSVRFGPFASRPTLWPPPPALVCALFPVVRVLYGRLRNRIVRTMVQEITPTPTQVARQREQREQREQQQQQRVQEELRRNHVRIQFRGRLHEQHQAQQPQQQQQQQEQQQMFAGPGAGLRFHFQLGDLFGFEMAHFVFDRPPAVGEPVGPGPGPGIAPAVAVADDGANGDDGRAVNNPADRQQQPHQDGPVQEPEGGPPAQAPEDQDPQQQQQQPPPEPQQQQQAEPGQGQEPPAGDEDPGAAAARAIRATGASLGRLVGGALLMPSIARVMGSILLHISHVVPLIRTIIAPLPPSIPPAPHSLGPISTLFGLLSTSQEWATSDPVWWRNTLGLGIFLVVKDGLKLLHLWLAKRELEERHIKNKSFAGIDMTGLELVERHRPKA